jgi:cytidylate kinase
MTHKSSSERLGEAMARSLRHWRARGKAEPAPTPGQPGPPPTIAISRQAGANGSAIARAVGERLGWPVYDRELLDRIAEEMGLRTELLESVDERRGSWLRERLETFSARQAVTQSAYVRHLVGVVLALGAHGSCVIVGRGAAQILPEEGTLRVRLVGPLEGRIAVLQAREGLGPAEAAQRVARTDRERTHFVKDHFRDDPDDPSRYDLVLNSSRFAEAECAGLIVEALGRLPGRAMAVPAAPPSP